MKTTPIKDKIKWVLDWVVIVVIIAAIIGLPAYLLATREKAKPVTITKIVEVERVVYKSEQFSDKEIELIRDVLDQLQKDCRK